MKSKIVLLGTFVSLISLGVGFWGGSTYQKIRPRQFMGNRQNAMIGRGPFRPISGEIVDVKDGLISVKLDDGQSRVVLQSEQTQVNKSTPAEFKDLSSGSKVVVFGSENPDGSISATTIQIGTEFRAKF